MGGVYDPTMTYFSSVEMLTPGSNDWVAGPPLPGPVERGQSVIHNDTIVVVGGNSYLGVVNTGIYRLDGDNWMTQVPVHIQAFQYFVPQNIPSTDTWSCHKQKGGPCSRLTGEHSSNFGHLLF